MIDYELRRISMKRMIIRNVFCQKAFSTEELKSLIHVIRPNCEIRNKMISRVIPSSRSPMSSSEQAVLPGMSGDWGKVSLVKKLFEPTTYFLVDRR